MEKGLLNAEEIKPETSGVSGPQTNRPTAVHYKRGGGWGGEYRKEQM